MAALPRSFWLYLLAWTLTLHALLFYGFPLAALAVVFVVLAAWFRFIGPGPALLVCGSLLVCTLLLNSAIKLLGLEQAMYYRPHELLVSKSRDSAFGDTYRPHVDFSMHAPFGDIEAMEKVGIAEPRDIAYHTDGLGFRNPSDYHGQRDVLVGDSFIAGLADTQSCITTEWLRREHQLDTYNLGFPGDMTDYVHRAQAFRQRYTNDFRLSLFVFEGNDFVPYKAGPTHRAGWLERYYGWFQDSAMWRYTRSLYLRSFKWGKKHEAGATVKDIGGQRVAFYAQDIAAVGNRTTLDENRLHFVAALEAIKPQLAHVFFVPTKYRVYAQWLTTEPLPNEQWRYLEQAAKQAGVPVHDLTPALVSAAKSQLRAGQYVYWRDDTHWNCNGMQAAANEIARVLKP